jgi:hypothetical protein
MVSPRLRGLGAFIAIVAITSVGAAAIDALYSAVIAGDGRWACRLGSFATFQALLIAMFAVPGAVAALVGRTILERGGQPASSRSLAATIVLIAAVPYAVLSLSPIGCI